MFSMKELSNINKTFLGTEAVLYFCIVILDITGLLTDVSGIIKFVGILDCLLMAVYIFVSNRARISLCISISLAFTLIADFFLIFPGRDIRPGLLSFVFAHIVYLCIIENFKLKRILPELVIRTGIASVVTIPIGRIAGFDYLSIYLLALYGTTFVMNYINCILKVVDRYQGRPESLKCKAEIPNGFLRLLFVGLSLFILCDINVALYNTLAGGFVYRLSSVLMWVFYLPSQVLLVLASSSIPYCEKKERLAPEKL